MAIYRAKRNTSFPDGIWRQGTDRDIDPEQDPYPRLIASGHIVYVGEATVEEVAPAGAAPRHDTGDHPRPLTEVLAGYDEEASDAPESDDTPAPHVPPPAPILASDTDTEDDQDPTE